jgi:uncharacterized membrane protein YphA (DoxX/SURF4 family)
MYILENNNRYLIYTILLLMFILSGIHKMNNYNETVLSLANKVNPMINLNNDLYKIAILLVILLEIIAPYILITSSYKNKHNKYSLYSVYLLIAFTIVATLLYHPLNINSYMKSIPFWSNVSLLGGLLFIAADVKK